MLSPPGVNRNQIVKRAGIALIAVGSLFVIVMTAPDPFGSKCPALDRLLPSERDWVFWTDRLDEIPLQSAILHGALRRLPATEKASSRQADALLHVLGILSSFRDHTLISGEMAVAGALAPRVAPGVAAPLGGVDHRPPSRIAWFVALWRPRGSALRRSLRALSHGGFFDRYVRDLLPADWGVSVEEGIIEIADPEALWTREPPRVGSRPPDSLFLATIRDLIVVSTDRRRLRDVILRVNEDSAPSVPLPAPPRGAILELGPTARRVLKSELGFLGVGPHLTLFRRLFVDAASTSPLTLHWLWREEPPALSIHFQGRPGLRAVPAELPSGDFAATLGVPPAFFRNALAESLGGEAIPTVDWNDHRGGILSLTGSWGPSRARWTAEGRPMTPPDSGDASVEVLAVRWRRPPRRRLGGAPPLLSLLPEALRARGRQDAHGGITLTISTESAGTSHE